VAGAVRHEQLAEGWDGRSVSQAPTRFGPVAYRIKSSAKSGTIEATIEPPTRSKPHEIVIRLRHPEGKPMKSVTVNGKAYKVFDPAKSIVRLKPSAKTITVVAKF
jgi:hypothetical protein